MSTDTRIATLESQVRTLRRMLFGVLGVVVVGGLLAATTLQSVPDVIRAKSFEVMQGNGFIAANLTSNEQGGLLELFDKDQRTARQIRSGSNSTGSTSVTDETDIDFEEVIEVTANELLQSFLDNEVKADLRFKSKTVAVTGSIKEINSTATGVLLALSTGVGSSKIERNMRTVRFEFPLSAASAIATFNKNQLVTLVGTCSGLSATGINVSITDCRIGPDPIATNNKRVLESKPVDELDAMKLSRDGIWEFFNAHQDKEVLLLNGTVDRVVDWTGLGTPHISVYLKHKDGPTVIAVFKGANIQQAKNLREGMTVKIKGEKNGYGELDYSCLLDN